MYNAQIYKMVYELQDIDEKLVFRQIIHSLKVIWTTFYPSAFLRKDRWVFSGFSKILSNINDNGTFLKYE